MQGLSQLGALVFVMGLSSRYAIYRQQLLGGVWINQTLPAVVLGLYTRWLNPWALLAGVGIASGTWMAAAVNFAATFPLTIGGPTAPGYIALRSLLLNLIVAAVLTVVLNAAGAARGGSDGGGGLCLGDHASPVGFGGSSAAEKPCANRLNPRRHPETHS